MPPQRSPSDSSSAAADPAAADSAETATPESASIPSPHDSLVKFVFSRPRFAAAALRRILPRALSRRIAWRTLRRVPGSFVDEQLRQRHTDLLFSVRLDGSDALLYVLFEHQSESDALMAYRMLRYMVKAWDGFLADHPGARRLPAVVPVLLHQGATGWSAPLELHALIDLDPASLEVVADYLPRFRVLLDDLAVLTDEELRRRRLPAMLTATLVMLSRARSSRDLLADLAAWTDVLRALATAQGGVAMLSALWHYVLQVSDLEPDQLHHFVRQLGPLTEDAYMTTAKKLTEQVRSQALAEGKAELIVKQLRLRFGALPADVLARVRSASTDQLEVWGECLLTAESLKAVFGAHGTAERTTRRR